MPDRSRDGFTLGSGWLLSRAYRHSLMCAACSEGRSKTAMVTASLSAACSALTPSGWCRELMGVELEEPGLEPRGDLELLLLLLLLEEREERDERIGSVHASPVVFRRLFWATQDPQPNQDQHCSHLTRHMLRFRERNFGATQHHFHI